MKIKVLKTLVTFSLALILCLGIMLVSFSFAPNTKEPVSTTTFSAQLEPGDDLYDFAYDLITSWFNDCLRYVGEDDPASEELEAEYEDIMKELDDNDDLDNLSNMLVFITSSFNRLDKIYYLWECNTYSEELEEAYRALKNSGAYNGNKVRIDKTYNEVLNLITVFKNELNPEDPEELDNTDRSLISDRVDKSGEIEIALGEAIAIFDEIQIEWKQGFNLILWLGISGGILFLAAVIVIILLVIMKKRNKKYKATLISFKDLQKVLDDEQHGR